MSLSLFMHLKKTVKNLAFVFVLLGSASSLWAEEKEVENRPTGLKPMTEEHVDHMMKNWGQVIGVKPNKLGASRIHFHANKHGMPTENIHTATSLEDEFITIKYGEIKAGSPLNQIYALPSSVNNSLLPSFPPIGDQGAEGSCVGWASTYYQASHEIGLANGLNNKDSNASILSPRWTYNMINYGKDGGAIPPEAFTLLSQNGAASIVNLPYQAGNYLPWDLNTQDWIDALSNRTSPPIFISNLDDPNSNAILLIKEALNNGHVVTFATYFYSWVFTKVKDHPSVSFDDNYVGQLACSWMNGYSGGHYITIVGYNDDIWIDVNGNDEVDEGEKGAFLVANSWGTSWGNDGFVWISYDAFYANSQVQNGPRRNRVPAADAMNNMVISITAKKPHYTPSLYAQFTLNQTKRNQIFLSGGLSDPSQEMPALIFESGAIVNQGGSYAFDGSTAKNPIMGTFVLDLTDLLQSSMSDNQRFWLSVKDNKKGAPTTISSYSITDVVHGTSVSNTTSVPNTIDNDIAELYIDYSFGSDTVENMPPVVQITYPPKNAVLSNTLLVTVASTDDFSVELVEIYLDGVLLGSESNPPYGAYFDTTKVSNGVHTLTAISYDGSKKSMQSITVSVNN